MGSQEPVTCAAVGLACRLFLRSDQKSLQLLNPMAKTTCGCPCHRPTKPRSLPRWQVFRQGDVLSTFVVEAESHYRAVQTASVVLKCDPTSVIASRLEENGLRDEASLAPAGSVR